MTTIAELLVRDGRWPTLEGPWGYQPTRKHGAADLVGEPQLAAWRKVRERLDRLRGDYWLPVQRVTFGGRNE